MEMRRHCLRPIRRKSRSFLFLSPGQRAALWRGWWGESVMRQIRLEWKVLSSRADMTLRAGDSLQLLPRLAVQLDTLNIDGNIETAQPADASRPA
ncbi:hypothetical protein EYF80_032811 [Liparis tanakae]|uniref:Uncharacterized protein n=1 Tax=Liparis tanakae TaxID=230148 RepID=A0A4Z2GUT4_9TELE|nr:hypothetical protein EYF80_032811 [Liparis tanakae]